MSKGKRWKDCAGCAHYQRATKDEGVCAFLTGYNQWPCYVYNRFFCKKWEDRDAAISEASKTDSGKN